jgi:hypothetical protein
MAGFEVPGDNDIDALPPEVIFPSLPPRMEQLRDSIRVWINARQVRTFVQVTVDAGESQLDLILENAG